jgi:hypothetical protein
MKTMMDRLQVEEDKLNLEQEDSHEDFEKMRSIFEKRIDLYKRFLKKEGLTELNRHRLENKREWIIITRTDLLFGTILDKIVCPLLMLFKIYNNC